MQIVYLSKIIQYGVSRFPSLRMRNTSKSRTIPRSLPKGSRSKAYKGKTTVSQPLRCQPADCPPAAEMSAADCLPAAQISAADCLPAAEMSAADCLPAAEMSAADCFPAAQMSAADCLSAAETSISGAAHRKLTFQTQGPAAPGLASNLYIIPQNARKENGERGESCSFSMGRFYLVTTGLPCVKSSKEGSSRGSSRAAS